MLASLGLRTLEEAVGRVDLLDSEAAVAHWKAVGLDLSAVLAEPDVPDDMPRHQTRGQDHGLEKALGSSVHGGVCRFVGGCHARLGGPAHLQCRPHGRDVARFGDQPALRLRRAARRHDLAHLHRIGRPELRRIRPERHDHAPLRRRQRLLRQGSLGRTPGRAAPGRVGVRRRGPDHRRQRHPLRRHGRRGFHPGPGR